MKRTTLVILIMLVAAGMFRFADAAPAPSSTAPAQRNAATSDYCAEPEELAFLKLINEYRAQNGLLPLALSQTIGAAAEHHSTDMARNDYFSHQLSNGITWSQNMTDHGYTYSTYRGENIAAGNELASNTFVQWKNSPAHDANMLSTSFYAIGIGRAYDANSTWKWYWTTNFGGKVDGPAVACGAQAPAATNTPRPTATKTPTPTKTATPRPTNTTQPTATKTPTNSPTPTATSTPKPTKTATPTATRTLEPTATRTPRPTETPLPTSTVTSEPEQPRIDSARATRTPRPTQTPEPTRTPRPTETPRPTRTPQPANTPFVDDSSTGSVSVSRVRATSSTRRGETTITIDITLRASDRGSVEGAVISVKVTDPSGKSTYLTGSTNRRGQVTIKMKTKSGAGTYSVAVADVQAPNRDYNSAENRATTATVRVR